MRSASRHGPWEDHPRRPELRRSYADAATTPFWLDSIQRPAPEAPLEGTEECDLAVVGGGLSGLWAAVLAKQDQPGRDVILLEGGRIAQAASGRNGGFFVSSLTHGIDNGLARFPEEMLELERLGLANFEATVSTISELGIECGLELTGSLDVAVEPHELAWLAEAAAGLREHGHRAVLLDRDRVRAEIHSPLFEGGLWQQTGAGLVDPARLCWGLARVARELGVRIHEQSPVARLRAAGGGVELVGAAGTLRARRAVLATSAYRGLVSAIRRRVLPVYDYVLVSEPLSAEQRTRIGWHNRQGVGDLANQFHYYRLTADDRILWGGYDAIYHYRGRVEQRFEQREQSFTRLAGHFFTAFPQLEGLRFSHRWGGAIDTCSRFFAFHGTALRGRVAYTVGHTGLGVCASRFGARVALDLVDGRRSEAAGLRTLRSRPMPFPPEPARWAAVQLTRNRLAAADRDSGRRGVWLRTLDRLGLGYDS